MSKLVPNILPKQNMSLNGFKELRDLTKCPCCEGNIWDAPILGYGEYPKGGYQNMLKPHDTLGVGIECPHCFEKLVHHCKESFKKSIDNYIKILKRKYKNKDIK